MRVIKTVSKDCLISQKYFVGKNACHVLVQYQSFIDNISVITTAVCFGSFTNDVIVITIFGKKVK